MSVKGPYSSQLEELAECLEGADIKYVLSTVLIGCRSMADAENLKRLLKEIREEHGDGQDD